MLNGHQHQIYAVAFDGIRVASGSLDSTVRIWSAKTGWVAITLPTVYREADTGTALPLAENAWRFCRVTPPSWASSSSPTLSS